MKDKLDDLEDEIKHLNRIILDLKYDLNTLKNALLTKSQILLLYGEYNE